MSKIRALVVEDSLTVRRHLVAVLQADADVTVIGEAADGQEAIELCQSLRPDVVVLDLVLPTVDGIAVTEHIMAYCPTPILIVSAPYGRLATADALAAGAVEVLEKPGDGQFDQSWERRFLATLKLVARIRVITHPRLRLQSDKPRLSVAAEQGAPACRAVGLGASTGGPGALSIILKAMPAPFPVPIIVVTHVDSAFGAALAEWLDQQTPHRVTLAQDGDVIAKGGGQVVLAPPDRHLVVDRGRLRLTDDPPVYSCRPSVDVLFRSMANEYEAACAACLLTGMGRDGAAGLLAIRKAGGLTVAQDEASSIVYGMPREAMLLGAASQVLPLDAIGPALTRAVTAAGPIGG